MDSGLGFPLESEAVGQDTRSEGGPVVSTPPDEHNTGLGDLALGTELDGVRLLDDTELAGLGLSHTGLLVVVVRGDVLGGVLDSVAVHLDGRVGGKGHDLSVTL